MSSAGEMSAKFMVLALFAPSQAALVTQSGSGTTNMCDTNTYCMVNDNVMRNTESNASVDCLHADLCTTLLPRSLNASPCTLPKLAATATGTGTRMMSPFPRVARGTATTLCSTPTRVRLPQATSPSAGCRLIPVSTPATATIIRCPLRHRRLRLLRRHLRLPPRRRRRHHLHRPRFRPRRHLRRRRRRRPRVRRHRMMAPLAPSAS